MDLSIYRLRKRGDQIHDVLIKSGLARFPLSIAGSAEATLYVRRPNSRPPTWAEFFSRHIDIKEFGKNASSAAVLLMVVEDEWFAVPFGVGGHALVDRHVIEDRFGLLTVLNSIPRNRVRSIDKTTLDARTQSLVQASRETSPQEFGLDVERDLVRGVTGSPEQVSLGFRLSGKDALRATLAIELVELPGRLKEYSLRSKAKDYKRHFAWIDHIKPVSDDAQIGELEGKAVQLIRDGDDAKCWMAVPDVIDWGQYVRFSYGGYKNRNLLHHDISLASWIAERGESRDGGFTAGEVDVSMLRTASVRCLDEDEREVDRWSLLECLSAEVDHKGRSYVLASGKWYLVDRNFVEEVDEYCRLIDRFDAVLPEYDDKSETAYNSRVCSQSNGAFALMDQKNIIFGAQTPVEFCDVYTGARDIVHVKRYSQSSVLSHLFAQGTVSGELFRSEAEFRRLVNDKLPPTHRLEQPARVPALDEHRIVFAIISAQVGDELTLPFFSRLNLRAATTRLRAYGYRVALAKIPVNDLRKVTKTYRKSTKASVG